MKEKKKKRKTCLLIEPTLLTAVILLAACSTLLRLQIERFHPYLAFSATREAPSIYCGTDGLMADGSECP
jgi:hypothetical protein